MQDNIIMIGMPASGKSTVGVLIAKALGKNFLDVDLVIQDKEGMLLQEIINEKGNDYFRKLEDEILSSLDYDNAVIAPGGSAIYYENAMINLKRLGLIVYLDVPFLEIEKRLNNMDSRGITLKEGQTLKDLFDERKPLYEKYADIKVEIKNIDLLETVQKVLDILKLKNHIK